MGEGATGAAAGRPVPAGARPGAADRAPQEAAGRPEQRGAGPDEENRCFGRRTRRAVIVLGPLAVVAVTVAGAWARGPVAYPVAWAAGGAVFVLPATVLAAVVRRRCGPTDRRFWSWWLAGQVVACLFGGCVLAHHLAPAVLQPAGFGLMAVAAGLWAVAAAYLASQTDGARILAIDALEVLLADVALVAPVLVAVGPRLAAARAPWFALPAAAVAAGLPVVAAVSGTISVRLPAHQRRPALLGTLAATVGELDAVAQAAQGTNGFHLPPAPLLAVNAVTMWLLLLQVVHAYRQSPEGLARLAPDAQVRRWSPLPLLALVSVPVLAVEAATAPASRPWVVPAVVAVLGAGMLLMTVRHLLVVSETARLYRQLAEEAGRRRRLLDDLVRVLEDDRHRVAVQLHELAVEWMAAIGAVLRTAGGDRGSAVVTGALERIYADLGARSEGLRRLMDVVRPPADPGQGLGPAVAASTASIFAGTAAPTVDVHVADGIALDWTTSTIVHHLVVEALRNALGRAPVQLVTVTVDSGGPGGALRVLVVDDAVGPDPVAGAEVPPPRGLRLIADLANGSVEVASRASGGRQVCAVLGRRP